MKPTEDEVNAIIAQESTGSMYFKSYDERQYILNMRKVREHFASPIDVYSCFRDFNKFVDKQVYVAKFRFSPARWKEVNQDKSLGHLDLAERFLLSCSVGLGQKIMLYLYRERLKELNNPKNAIDYCKLFVHNEVAQRKQVHKDLEYWFKQAKGDRLLGFSMYNAGFVKEYNAYGLEIMERLKNVSKQPKPENK